MTEVGRELRYELGSASPNVHSGRMDVLWQQFGRSCLPGRTSRLAATVRRDSQQETFEVSEAVRGRVRVQMRVRVRLCRTSIPAEWTCWGAVCLRGHQRDPLCSENSLTHRPSAPTRIHSGSQEQMAVASLRRPSQGRPASMLRLIFREAR